MSSKANFPEAAFEKITWSYGEHTVLKEITTSIEKKQFTSILGPNGSGKTTLLKQLLRILPVKEESVFIEDQDITTLSRQEMAWRIGMVPQDERTGYRFTVEDMVKLGRYAREDQTNLRSEQEVIERVLHLTNTSELRDHVVTELSGGEYQRVVIARALAQEPRILALDEPTTHLDPHHQLEILRLLKQLISREDLTVICVMHDLNSAMCFSDTVILLHEGTIFGHGKPEQMLRPQILKEVYGIETKLVTDPFTGKPLIAVDTRS
jgi:iron complex transport system ATP-binding protein